VDEEVIMSNSSEARRVGTTHVEAMGRKDFAAMEKQFAADVAFKGPGGALNGRETVLDAYRRLGPILERNDVRKILVDGDDVCVIYDFVTDTPGGAIATVEWLQLVDGRIRAIWLLFDRGPWPKVLEELERRMAKAKSA
jgi:hypothetical protein